MTNIAEKIQKIIAKADSTTSEHESALFMQKAHELMTAHGISLLDLGKLGDDPVAVDEDSVQHPARHTWAPKLASALAAFYGVRYVRGPVGTAMVYTVVGRESARVTFSLMYPFIHRQVIELAKKAKNEGLYKSIRTGAVSIGNALTLRVWELVPKAEEQTHGTGVNALVPVDLIEEMMNERFPHRRNARQGKMRIDANGVRLAKQVSLNVQTNGAGTKRLASN